VVLLCIRRVTVKGEPVRWWFLAKALGMGMAVVWLILLLNYRGQSDDSNDCVW